jgi:uncharacterized protein YbgA (DUF1722 family)/uncharacterized protein YbbK (DUF523 family)
LNDGFPRPRLVASKCLGFEACRYDGGMISSDAVEQLREATDFLPVCAEMEIGLGVPRRFVRVIGVGPKARLVQPATGLDVTDKMNSFAGSHLSSLRDIDGFILKSRSPSCGIKDVKHYTAAEKGFAAETSAGLFGAAVLEAFPGTAVEDEDRLRNLRIRDHFLTRIFTAARFRRARDAKDIRALIDFHSDNKYLLMVHGPDTMQKLGRLVANHDIRPLASVLEDYGRLLGVAMAKGPTFKAYINFIQHAFGYVTKELGRQERELFLDTLDLYREDRVPLESPMSLLRAWVARFNVGYLKRQTIFRPYPSALSPGLDPAREKDYWK